MFCMHYLNFIFVKKKMVVAKKNIKVFKKIILFQRVLFDKNHYFTV